MKNNYFLFVFILLLKSTSFAQPGTLDYSFGDSGVSYNPILAEIDASALQKDGRILYGGLSSKYPYYYIARHYTNGSIDSTFGKNGISNLPNLSVLTGIQVLEDGRILTGGNAFGDAAAAMFKPDGTLDSSFGANGFSIVDYGESEYINTMGVLPDGKILLAGSKNTIDVSIYMLTVRLNADGSRDKNFGDNGQVVNKSGREVTCLDIQSDGKFITAGHLSNGGPVDNFIINRYNNDGSLDKNFGSNGLTVTSFEGGNSIPYVIKILPDGKFLVAGVWVSTAKGLHSDMVITRYNSDGSLDKTFGYGGEVFIDFGKSSAIATNLLIQKDSKLILTGYTDNCYGCGNTNFALARLNSVGIIDSSFGVAGKEINDFGNSAFSTKSELQEDNKIIMLGADVNTASIILARYNNDLDKQQILITKIKHWLQHHNGFTWDGNNTISSYVVQRSADGEHWSTVHSQPFIANSQPQKANSFYYNDLSPLNGTNYYRVQTTSTSGAVAYSNVIAVSNYDIKLSPNPATNNLQIQGLRSNQKINLTVVDVAGNIAISQLLKANSNSSYNLNIASLHAGSYLLKIETNDDVITKHFVKE